MDAALRCFDDLEEHDVPLPQFSDPDFSAGEVELSSSDELSASRTELPEVDDKSFEDKTWT